MQGVAHTQYRWKGVTYTRDLLVSKIWGYENTGDSRTVDVHIRWLRLKIEEDPASPEYIQTVRGFGYRLRVPGEDA